MRKKSKTFIIVSLILLLLIGGPCLLLYTVLDTAKITCYGFGIDSSGTVYLGFTGNIMKYKDGKKIGRITKIPRGYAFELLHDDTIHCSNHKDTYIMDLNGKEIGIIKNTGSEEYDRMLREKNIFLASDGQKYEMRNPFGRRIITSEDGDVIWQMPLWDYLLLVIAFISILMAMGCVIIILFHFRIEQDWSL